MLHSGAAQVALPHRPRVSFIGSGFAGHSTRFRNLRRVAMDDSRISATFHEVTGWSEGGLIERMPLGSRAFKGRVRSVLQTTRVARVPRPDAIWTSVREELAPFFWAQRGPLRRPMLYDLDCTDAQLEDMSWEYFGRAPKSGRQHQRARLQERLIHSQVSRFVAWSNWAKHGLEAEGIDPGRISVIPPGVDLGSWSVPRRDTGHSTLRVLFVGGDFRRKGGDLLLQAAAARADELEVLMVTRQDVGPLPGNVRVLRAEANSTSLRDAFAWADIFVMPTRAECFGIATVEAMASGLPAIVGDIGGARDIVVDGETGWLIEPHAAALENALGEALSNRANLRTAGIRARARAERLFDGHRNDRAVVDLILESLAAR